MTMTERSYSDVQAAFPAVDVGDEPGLAERLANMAELADGYRCQAENLAKALESNREIGVAVGLIMAQYNLGHQAAVGVLIRLSQNTNSKLRDLAVKLIEAEDAEYASTVQRVPAVPDGIMSRNAVSTRPNRLKSVPTLDTHETAERPASDVEAGRPRGSS